MPHRDDPQQRAQRRKSILVRHDSRWQTYGFSEEDRRRWHRAGVPINRAPAAAILREVNYRGYALQPDSVARTKLGGRSILGLVLDGASAMDIERALALHRPRTTGRDSAAAWRRDILQPEFEPITNLSDAAIAIRSANVRAIQHALRRWGETRAGVYERRASLLQEALRYAEGGRSPSAQLITYGRGFGVFDHRALRALAGTLPRPGETQSTTRGALLLANPERWLLARLQSDRTPTPRQRSSVADLLRGLPAAPGCALIIGPDHDDGTYLAWTRDGSHLTALSIPVPAVETMMRTRVSTLPPSARPTSVDLTHDLAAARIAVDPTLLAVAGVADLLFDEADLEARITEGRIIQLTEPPATTTAPSPAPAVAAAPERAPETPAPERDAKVPAAEAPSPPTINEGSPEVAPAPAATVLNRSDADEPGAAARQEQERAATRTRLLTREDDSWAAYGFSPNERANWVRFGIPANRAPLAAIAREVTDVVGFTLTPDRLYTRITGGQTILDALLTGTTAWRLEQRIARALNAELVNSPHAWCRDMLHPPSFDSTGGDHGVLSGAIHTTRLPALQDALLNWADKATPLLAQRSRLGMEAHAYRRGFDPDQKLLQYARGFGITHVGPELRDLAGSIPYPHEVHLDILAAGVFRSNSEDRFLYRGRDDARDLVSAHMGSSDPLRFSPEMLPSPTGLAWLCDDDAHGIVVAWSIDRAQTLSAVTVPADRLIAAVRGSDPLRLRAEVGWVAMHAPTDGINGSDRAIAAVAALTEMHARDPEPVERTHQLTGGGRSTTSHSVSILHPGPRGPRGPKGTGPERTHQWKVRGHWRNQWYPSTQEYRRIWIKDFMQGPSDAPIINLDRVRLVR